MQSQNFLLESLFILISLDKWLHGVNLLYLHIFIYIYCHVPKNITSV